MIGQDELLYILTYLVSSSIHTVHVCNHRAVYLVANEVFAFVQSKVGSYMDLIIFRLQYYLTSKL